MFSLTSMCFSTDLQTLKKNKKMHILQPVRYKTIGIGNFKGQFLKITLSEKLFMVLYTTWLYIKK